MLEEPDAGFEDEVVPPEVSDFDESEPAVLAEPEELAEPALEELQRTNRELRKQLRGLQRELGEVRAAISAGAAPVEMLATLAEVAGDAWTPQVERAWNDAYAAIAGLMLDGARRGAMPSPPADALAAAPSPG